MCQKLNGNSDINLCWIFSHNFRLMYFSFEDKQIQFQYVQVQFWLTMTWIPRKQFCTKSWWKKGCVVLLFRVEQKMIKKLKVRNFAFVFEELWTPTCIHNCHDYYAKTSYCVFVAFWKWRFIGQIILNRDDLILIIIEETGSSFV